ncbi:MAG: lytic transglycosylase domain-containing protein [Kiritimatiellia bacterium]
MTTKMVVLWGALIMAQAAVAQSQRATLPDGDHLLRPPWELPAPELIRTPDRLTSATRAGTGLPLFFTRILPVLKEAFASENVPEHLVWLVEVESAFNPLAESNSGAVGLFQLMPETALRYGLKLEPLDERKLPDKSARAAARYLRELHERFGCWTLALAAYNAGEGLVERTMQTYALATFDELEPHLPQQTRSYVPRVIAIASVREASM